MGRLEQAFHRRRNINDPKTFFEYSSSVVNAISDHTGLYTH